MNTLDFLKANEHKSVDACISKAQYLKENWPWLKYSYAIAIKVRRRMKELGVTQKELARRLECTQQHISVLLGGRANMTLETLAKLEQALSFNLIGNGLQDFNYALQEERTGVYLKTSDFVDGYKPRKKKGPKRPPTTL